MLNVAITLKGHSGSADKECKLQLPIHSSL